MLSGTVALCQNEHWHLGLSVGYLYLILSSYLLSDVDDTFPQVAQHDA